jgi:DNA-binding Xre family transcriptional regulator
MSMECENKGLPGFNAAISKKGILRKTIAEKVGIPYTTLWKIVSGELKRIDPVILKKIAIELECSIDDLLASSNPRQPPPYPAEADEERKKDNNSITKGVVVTVQITVNSEGANTQLLVNLPGIISSEDCPKILEEIRKQILDRVEKLNG